MCPFSLARGSKCLLVHLAESCLELDIPQLHSLGYADALIGRSGWALALPILFKLITASNSGYGAESQQCCSVSGNKNDCWIHEPDTCDHTSTIINSLCQSDQILICPEVPDWSDVWYAPKCPSHAVVLPAQACIFLSIFKYWCNELFPHLPSFVTCTVEY